MDSSFRSSEEDYHETANLTISPFSVKIPSVSDQTFYYDLCCLSQNCKYNRKPDNKMVRCFMCLYNYHVNCVDLEKDVVIWNCLRCHRLPETVDILMTKMNDMLETMNTIRQSQELIVENMTNELNITENVPDKVSELISKCDTLISQVKQPTTRYNEHMSEEKADDLDQCPPSVPIRPIIPPRHNRYLGRKIESKKHKDTDSKSPVSVEKNVMPSDGLDVNLPKKKPNSDQKASARPISLSSRVKRLIIGNGLIKQLKSLRSDVAIPSKGDMNLDKIKEHLAQVATKSLKSVVTGPDNLHGFTTVKEILDRYEQILKEAIRTAEEPIIVSSIYKTTSLLSSKQNHMRKGINVGMRRLCDTLDCIYIYTDNDKNFTSNEDSHSSMLLAANLGFRDFVSVNTAKRHLHVTYHPALHYSVATQSQDMYFRLK